MRPKYGWKLLMQARSRQQLGFILRKGMEFLGIWKALNFFQKKITKSTF